MKALRIITAAVALACTAASAYAQRPNGYSVILLLGEVQGSGAGDLPPATGVRKALSDVKDFLPYRSYKVLDTQWLRSGMTHMKGADDQEYEVTVNAEEFMRVPGGGMMPYDPASGKPPVIDVRFHLQESGAATVPGEEYARSVQAAELEKQRASLEIQLKNDRAAMVPEMAARIKRLEAQIRLARARRLMDSKFEMAPGETVVVGTSKIGGGDRGLVVLLTAVTSGGK